MCGCDIILIFKLKRTNYKNAICDDRMMTRVNARRGPRSRRTRLGHRSVQAPLDLHLRSVRPRRIVENTADTFGSQRPAPRRSINVGRATPDTFGMAYLNQNNSQHATTLIIASLPPYERINQSRQVIRIREEF